MRKMETDRDNGECGSKGEGIREIKCPLLCGWIRNVCGSYQCQMVNLGGFLS